MKPIVLKATTEEGAPLEATFLPDKGMNLISYKRGDVEIIDLSTKHDFEETLSGLGPLIGPHFYQRRPEVIPRLETPERFPHIAKVMEQGSTDPFTHGVSRYAPWNFKATPTSISAKLTGKDTWNDVPLSEIEGQEFTMGFEAKLLPTGLHLELSVVSETDSIVGIHYFYNLPRGTGTVTSEVQKTYYDPNKEKTIPEAWLEDGTQTLTFNLNEKADYAFHPFPHPREGDILLDAGDYRLRTTYQCPSQENAWQLYHPKGASFVCIEPVSSQNPRCVNLTVSSIAIQLQILNPED